MLFLKYFIGIDIGTSSTKAVLFDELGTSLLSASSEYNIISPKLGYIEENPNDWLKATIITIKEITKTYPVIEGIGLSGQMHGLVLLDKNDKILRNSIIWCDNRTGKEKEEIEKKIGNQRIKEITGNDVMAPFTLAKFLWVKNNEPEIYGKIAKIMLPKDYIRYILTGSFTTEYSDASGMQMLDIYNKCYSNEILDKFAININFLPKLQESVDISGYIIPSLAKELGLKNIPFVVGGAGDQAAAAIGNGIILPSDVSIVLGSSGVVFNPILKEDIKPNLPVQVFMHAIKDIYHVMGVTNGCGLSYKWFKDNFCETEEIEAKINKQSVYEIINRKALSSPAGANGLLYLPYLNGERTPHNDPYATGTFVGIRQSTNKDDFARAVLEGISYSIRDCYSLLKPNRYNVYLSGGGAKGNLWRQIIADNLKCDIYRIEQQEGGALGVAILAMVAAGIYNNVLDAKEKIIKVKDITKPNKENYKVYDTRYEAYKALYYSLKGFFKKY